MRRFGLDRRVSFSLVFGLVFGLLPLEAFAFVPRFEKTWVSPRVAAILAAKASGDRVELVEARTADSTLFANPDGTFTTEISAGPIRFPDGKGGWIPLDTTLVADSSGVHPKGAASGLVFSRGGVDPLATLGFSTTSLALTWDGGALPQPVLSGNTATYPNVLPNVDLVLTATADGYAKYFVVKERPVSDLILPFSFSTIGLSIAADASGGLSLKDSAGRLVALGEPPVMWGAEFDPRSDEPVRSAPVSFSFSKKVGGWSLVLSPDSGFFDDPEVSYPVVVDPSSSLTVSSDTWVQSDSTVSKWTNTELRAGTFDSGSTKARSLLSFDTSSLAGKHILSATLNLWEFHAWSCSAREVQVFKVTSSWGSSTVWSNQPSVASTVYGSANVATGYSASCPDGWIGIPVAGLVQEWANGTANYGLGSAAGLMSRFMRR